ncbi:MAG: hypothetical protein ACK2UK_12515 [Candidatus Promineifilaceae bacterium]
MSSQNELKQQELLEAEEQEGSRSGISGLVFVGCLLLGLAVGFLINNIVVGLIGGLGVGFLAMAAARYTTGSW